MTRYRRKVEYVEARQWHEGDPPIRGMRPMEGSDPDTLYIRTPLGVRLVHDGDWIVWNAIVSVIVKPGDFEQAYEPVE